MLTAKDGDLDEAEALETGADDYLTKPFSFPVLVARIRGAAAAGHRAQPHPCDVGDLRIDPGQRRAWRGDVEIKLTSRQFDVLEFLVRRAGQVLSKAEILKGVWEYDFEGDPNIVEVYIRRLRTPHRRAVRTSNDRDRPGCGIPARHQTADEAILDPVADHRFSPPSRWRWSWCSPPSGWSRSTAANLQPMSTRPSPKELRI